MANANQYPSHLAIRTVTIQSGQTLSNAIDLHGTALVAVVTPAQLTSKSFKFEAGIDNQNFLEVYDDGGRILSITVGISRFISITTLSDFNGIRFLKLKGNLSEAADRIITLVLGGMVRR